MRTVDYRMALGGHPAFAREAGGYANALTYYPSMRLNGGADQAPPPQFSTVGPGY